MKSLTGKYFIVGVRYEKTLEDGTNAKTTEQYVVDALSWSECEAKTTDEMAMYTNGDMEIVTMKKAGFSELFLSEVDSEDKYYDCSINMITIDEKSNKEKKTKVRYLVQGDTIEKARKNVDEIMGKTMIISLKSPYGVVLLSLMVERPSKSDKGCGFDPHSSNYDFRFNKG